MTPVNISEIVNEALRLLRASLPTTITFDLDIDQNCSWVNADATQIHQVILNLGTNAGHAMEKGGGNLRVRLKDREVTEGDLVERKELQPGHYVQLTVQDSGKGIPPEDLERIFDPFFTTKETGKGTGMGLAVVHGIVASHNGAISARSKEEEGTSFTVLLPAIVERGNQQLKTPETMVMGQQQRVMVVDDEEAIVKLNAMRLERLGYLVTQVSDSRKALTLFTSDPTMYDLIITDQTMPHITGYELAQRFLAIRPELPIILCTGYSSLVDEKMARSLGIKDFAMKPVTMELLAQKVSDLLHTGVEK